MANEHAHHEAHGVDDHHPHVMPVSILVGVYVVLIALTALTVAVTYIELGPLNVWVALLVAAVKAAVVALYYMHLKYENGFLGQVLIGSLFFVALFIGITLMDTWEYAPTINEAVDARTTAQPLEAPTTPEPATSPASAEDS